MYSKKESIQGVQDYRLTADGLLMVQSGQLKFFKDLIQEWVSSELAGEIILTKNFIACVSQANTTIFNYTDGSTKFKLNNFHGVYQDQDSNHILGDFFEGENRVSALYSPNEHDFLWKIEEKRGSRNYMDDNHCFISQFRKDNIFKSYDLNTGKTLWVFDTHNLGTYMDGALEKNIQLMNFSGVYNNHLIATMNNGGILLLDIIDGKSEGFFMNAQLRLNLNPSEHQSSVFYGLNHFTFVELDVEKKKISRKLNIEDLLRSTFVTKEIKAVNHSIVHQNLIYFIAGHDSIGIFDPINEKIIWKFHFDFTQKGTILKSEIKGLQVNENNLFVLDNRNDLHVFQKV